MFWNKLIVKKRISKMNTIKLILVALLISCFGTISAQFTDTKTISKKFAVTPDTRIEVTNKYGDIEFNTWEKDSVVFLISIKVEERKLSRLEKSMAQIDFDFTNSRHFIIARTAIGKNMNLLEKEFLKFKETILQPEGSMEIHYKIWLPAQNSLKVENKFGNVYLGDFNGRTEIDLSNGNLKAHDFTGRLELNLNFADATLNSVKTARLNCNYSNFYLKSADNLRIASKSSTLEIQEVNDLDTDSRRDKFRITQAGSVIGQGNFSNFRINELTGRLNLRADYGDIDIRETAVDFSNILIESKSADVNLYFHNESNFGFEITHEKSKLYLCNEMHVAEEKTLDEKENRIELKGTFSNGNDLPAKLYINAVSGEVNIFAH